MVKSHYFCFFGEKTGLILLSKSKYSPYLLLKFIKKKINGSWERPREGEGRVFKLSLEEIATFLRLLEDEIKEWKRYHPYSNEIEIAINWEETSKKRLWINVSGYSKLLRNNEVLILKKLIKHIFEEKIIYSTNVSIDSFNSEENISLKYEKVSSESNHQKGGKNLIEITGRLIKETQKAVLIAFNSFDGFWIPKSTIHNNFNPKKCSNQKFVIDKWILKQNNLIT